MSAASEPRTKRAGFSTCQHTSAYVSIRQHTSAYVSRAAHEARRVLNL